MDLAADGNPHQNKYLETDARPEEPRARIHGLAEDSAFGENHLSALVVHPAAG